MKRRKSHVAAVERALAELGYSGDAESGETATRWLSVLEDYAPGQPVPALETFPAPGRDLVRFSGLPFHSLCAHHLLPFFGSAEIAYRPEAHIAGLGAVARALRHFARQPQLQERLAAQLADHLHGALQAPVAVRLRARQLCMEMRGVESPGEIEVLALRGELAGGLLA
jgi:GTP cyclohydrolase IA